MIRPRRYNVIRMREESELAKGLTIPLKQPFGDEEDIRKEIRELGSEYLEVMRQGFNVNIIERTLPIRERQTLLLTKVLEFAMNNPKKRTSIRKLQTEVELLDKVSQSVNWWYTDIIEMQRLRYLARGDKEERVHQSYKSKLFSEQENATPN